jgi:hypothetical protein
MSVTFGEIQEAFKGWWDDGYYCYLKTNFKGSRARFTWYASHQDSGDVMQGIEGDAAAAMTALKNAITQHQLLAGAGEHEGAGS